MNTHGHYVAAFYKAPYWYCVDSFNHIVFTRQLDDFINYICTTLHAVDLSFIGDRVDDQSWHELFNLTQQYILYISVLNKIIYFRMNICSTHVFQ